MLNIESRRYIGNKTKLSKWIMDLISKNTNDVHIFCDIFAGTGTISNHALQIYDHVIINDFLYSNNVIYKAFFGKGEWDSEKLNEIAESYNRLNGNEIEDNYFSINFGNKFFDMSTARKTGYIREDIEKRKAELNEKEKDILLASLIYSIDRIANTLGHFDAYIKKPITRKNFRFDIVNAKSYDNVKIFQEDSNELARKIHSDIVYVDPPYNSRQYSRFYHVYENLVKWQKPKLYGSAMKPEPENMSDYCRSSALEVFKDLIEHLDTKYIAVSYNNTYKSKSKSSRNRISLEDLKATLSSRGETKVFAHDYNAFQAGKTDLKEHKEFLFITKI